jgi:UDP-glucose 6-dehydrogenase
LRARLKIYDWQSHRGFHHPDRVVVGLNEKDRRIAQLCADDHSNRVDVGRIIEMIEERSRFLATSVTFINELKQETSGADAKDVERGLKRTDRLSRPILRWAAHSARHDARRRRPQSAGARAGRKSRARWR